MKKPASAIVTPEAEEALRLLVKSIRAIRQPKPMPRARPPKKPVQPKSDREFGRWLKSVRQERRARHHADMEFAQIRTIVDCFRRAVGHTVTHEQWAVLQYLFDKALCEHGMMERRIKA